MTDRYTEIRQHDNMTIAEQQAFARRQVASIKPSSIDEAIAEMRILERELEGMRMVSDNPWFDAFGYIQGRVFDIEQLLLQK